MGVFSFLRRKTPEDYPELPEPLWRTASRDRPALLSLAPADAALARRTASWFLETRDLRPMEGAAPRDGDLAILALLASLPVLRLGVRWYDDWKTVFLAPDGFVHTMTDVDGSGVVTEYDDELSGRVTELGPILLSLPDIRESGLGDGYNVVIHELAHKLDERDGELDGCPPLPRSIPSRRWTEVFSAAYEDFTTRAGAGRRRGRRRSSRLPLDEYAAESPDEFFAVACEHFFDTPRRLRDAYPDMYGLLAAFFGYDTLGV